MDFTTAAQLLALCQEGSVTLGEAMLRREMDLTGASREEIMARLERSLEIMEQAAAAALAAPQKTMGGLIGGEAIALEARREAGKAVCGPLLARSAAIAMGTLEVNASMGLIVAAPTAGSCGVLPGALLGQAEAFGFKREALLEGLLTASAVGYLIARNATIAGAEGGCQAEVGSACSMAAAGLAELFGMEIDQIEYAAEVAMEHHLGLTCDPICGLVQIPCIERNAVAAMRAINALSLANFLTHTRKISFDVVIKTMYETGRDLFSKYRETSEGGLAKTYFE